MEPDGTLNVGGEECRTYHTAEFRQIRDAYGLADDFLKDFHWKLRSGGGKGGNLMGFTADRQFLVKEVKGDDHATMLEITADYRSHVLSPEGEA